MKKQILEKIQKNVELQSQEIYVDKKNSKKIWHILEDSASGVQVEDVEQVTILNLLKVC